MRYSILAAAVAVAFTAVPAAADTTITGAGFRIPPTATAGTSTSTAVSADSGTVTGLVLTLTGLTHTFIGDLNFTLSHGATTLSFANFQTPGLGGSSNNLNGTYVIRDTGAILFSSFGSSSTNSDIPVGTYRGDTTFASAFGGASALGNWTLSINDDQNSDIGQLDSWSLAITTAQAAVPEPATWALMITGFGAVGASMRRRKASSLATA